MHVELRRWIRDWRVTVCDQRSRGPVPAVQRWTWAHGEPAGYRESDCKIDSAPFLGWKYSDVQPNEEEDRQKIATDWMRG